MAGFKPEEELSRVHMLRMTEAIHEACKIQAMKERRSLNAQLLKVIENWLEKIEEKSQHALVSAGDS